MPLILAPLIADLEALWSAPTSGGDPVTDIGNALETYWSSATVAGITMVPPTTGITQSGLAPLRSPNGTAITAALAFQTAMLTMILASVWPSPAIPPPIPNPAPLQGLLLPIISVPVPVSVAPAFAAAIDSWCRGTIVNVQSGPAVVPTPVL